MRNKFLIIGGIMVTASAIFIACTDTSADTKKKGMTKEELVKRGEYLVNTIGCDDCHSPKRMGGHEPEIIEELRFSGYPSSRAILPVDTNSIKKGCMMLGSDLTSAVGPWGMSFTANISSDATGIGNWSEAQFIKALREGKYKGQDNNRPLLPPMPWFVYKNMTDDDLRSIYAYLQSSKPVNNVVPAPIAWKDLK